MVNSESVNRVDTVLSGQPAGLWPFLAAGHPSLDATASLLRAFNDLPIRGVELGFPFSDSIADGPVIQQAFSESLSRGLRVGQVFDQVSSMRGELRYPLLAMVSMSIVCRLGVDAFVARAAAAGFDGLIVPDLSLEEASRLAEAAGHHGMRLSMLIAPTTSPQRERQIAGLASGFLYYVSVQGTTGERGALAADLRGHVERLKAASRLPVLVGFGISTPQHVRDVCAFADGAIVGSAIARRITSCLREGVDGDRLVSGVSDFVGELAGGRDSPSC